MCCTYKHADKHQKSLAVVFQVPFVLFGMRCVCLCVCVSYSQGHACVHTCAWTRRGQISMLGVFCCQPYYLETTSLLNLEAFRFDWLAGNQLEFACLCCPVLELQTHPAVSGISHEWWGFEFSPCACGARALIHWAISWASHLVLGGCIFHGLGVWKVG